MKVRGFGPQPSSALLIRCRVALVLVWSLLLRGGSALSSSPAKKEERLWQVEADSSLVASPFLNPPVVGVFSQPLPSTARYTDPSSTSRRRKSDNDAPLFYVAASYVKWLESGGALAVPIPYDASPDLLDELLEQVHLLFLPGGQAELSPAIQYALSKIDARNREKGGWFPLWGTCLGMEFLVSHFGRLIPLPETFDAENMTLPLQNVEREALYDDQSLYEIVTSRNVTFNNHRQGISPQTFQSNPLLTERWRITSTNVDRIGRPFVSTIEPLHAGAPPYYGTQYHPEKNAFEYGLQRGVSGRAVPFEVIDHSPAGLHLSHALARFVGDLARQSQRHNAGLHDYTRPDRFPPLHVYPTVASVAFEQLHVVPSAAAWSNKSASSALRRGSPQLWHREAGLFAVQSD